MHVEELLNRLEKVKPNGRNKWMACCPAHGDKSPSLSIGVGHNGGIILNCFAGCTAQDVCIALGVEMSELFPSDRYIQHTRKHVNQSAPAKPKPGRFFPQHELDEIDSQIHFAFHFLHALESKSKFSADDAQTFLRIFSNLQNVSGDLVDAEDKFRYRQIGEIVIKKNRLFAEW